MVKCRRDWRRSDDRSSEAPEPDDELLRAEPISRKRMDLLWLDPPHLARLEATLGQAEVVSVVMGHSPEGMNGHDITREDYAWARRIEKIVDKAYLAGQNGDYREAVRHYQAALREAPGCDLFLMSIGVAYVHLGERELGLRYLERAAEISPENGRIRKNLAHARG